jgi:hypothetical protein
MRRHLTLALSLVSVLLVIACRKATEPAALGPDPAASPADSPAPAAEDSEPSEHPGPNPTYEAYDGPLVAGDWSGVSLLDERGAVERVISDKPGHHPRWLEPGVSLVVLRHDKDLSLVEIDITSGVERTIARNLVGDSLECPKGSVYTLAEDYVGDHYTLEDFGESFTVQDDHQFLVSAESGVACVWLMDRNFNMHTAAVEAKVHLDDGAVDRRLLRANHCEPNPEWIDDDPLCTSLRLTVTNPSPNSKELEAMGPYQVRDGALWLRGRATNEPVAGPFPGHPNPEYPNYGEELIGLETFEPTSLSPSGRWAVLFGNGYWGDLYHMQWLLLDTQSGELFAITEPKWPAPLSHEALSRLEVDNDIVSESTKVWLSGDRLVMQTWLIIPGETVVEVPGDLAR